MKYTPETIEQAEGLIRQNRGLREAYASVCQSTTSVFPIPKLEAVKQYLEHLMALEVMEEYGWRQESDGRWLQEWESDV